MRLPRMSPAEANVHAGGILDFVNELEQARMGNHSFMLLRAGAVIAEGTWHPFLPESPHLLHSLSKSFTAAAVGLAIGEGRLTLDDPVIDFFPDDLPAEVSPNLAAMRVRHLLSMSVGQPNDDMGQLSDNWARAFLAREVTYEPGSRFLYSSTATYMLSAILQRTTGEFLTDYLRPRLLDPIGIGAAHWQTCPQGIATGGWGLSLPIDAIARFGLLYLQDGVWEGKRVLPEGWVAEASRSHISNGTDPNNDWAQGYGFQFWRSRHGAYRGDGAFGQFCIIHPELDFVLAMTGGSDDMGSVMNAAWRHLLPAMNATGDDQAALDAKLSNLKMPPRSDMGGAFPASLAGTYSGPTGRVRIDAGPHQTQITFERKDRTFDLVIGNGDWAIGEFELGFDGFGPVGATSVVTKDDEVAAAELVHLESPVWARLAFASADQALTLRLHRYCLFGPGETPDEVFTRQTD